MASKTVRWLWWCTAAASLWLRSGFPTLALAAPFDDALFMRLAGSLGSGHWLGAYDKLTLVKGMVYPLFILSAFVAGIPLNLAEQALYIGACAIAGSLVRREAGPWPGVLVFAALAFNPILLNGDMSRVIREAIYISWSLALVAVLVWVVVPGREERWRRQAMVRGLVLGAVFAAFWLTREEGLWLLPALATILLVAAPGWWRAPVLAKRAMTSLVVACIVGGGLIGGVAAANRAAYGRFLTSEFKTADFGRGYGALARIHHDSWRRYVIFPKEARERAYEVSPAAAELRPVFEGPIGEGWRRSGCEQTGTTDCPEILSGWFMWALRDAVEQAGHTGSAAEAMSFYRKLADEIDAACDRGAITCDPSRATLMPPFRWHYVSDAAEVAVRIGKLLIYMGNGDLASRHSQGPRVVLLTFVDTVGAIRSTDVHVRYIEGLIAAKQAVPELRIRGDSQASTTFIDLAPLPNEAADPFARKFSVMTDCQTGCELVVSVVGSKDIVVPWSQLAPGDFSIGPGIRLSVEAATDRYPGRAGAARRTVLSHIAAGIAELYAWMVPVLSALGAVGLTLSVALRRAVSPNQTLLALAIASLVAVLCRIALLAYLDVTSIPSAHILYAAPASSFVLLFALTGLILGLQSLVRN